MKFTYKNSKIFHQNEKTHLADIGLTRIATLMFAILPFRITTMKTRASIGRLQLELLFLRQDIARIGENYGYVDC